MKITFTPQYYSYNPSFNGKIDKLIDSIKGISDYKRARISLAEAIKVYNQMGYTIRKKASSHMTVTAPDGFEFSLKIPHGTEKRFIGPFDVRRLKCVVNNDKEGLINSIKI